MGSGAEREEGNKGTGRNVSTAEPATAGSVEEEAWVDNGLSSKEMEGCRCPRKTKKKISASREEEDDLQRGE